MVNPTAFFAFALIFCKWQLCVRSWVRFHLPPGSLAFTPPISAGCSFPDTCQEQICFLHSLRMPQCSVLLSSPDWSSEIKGVCLNRSVGNVWLHATAFFSHILTCETLSYTLLFLLIFVECQQLSLQSGHLTTGWSSNSTLFGLEKPQWEQAVIGFQHQVNSQLQDNAVTIPINCL